MHYIEIIILIFFSRRTDKLHVRFVIHNMMMISSKIYHHKSLDTFCCVQSWQKIAVFAHRARNLYSGDDDGGRAAAGAVAHPRPLQLPLLLRGLPRGQRRQGEHSPAEEHQQPGRMHQAGQYQQPSGYTGVIHYLESMLNRR